jgi:hypothetical protein
MMRIPMGIVCSVVGAAVLSYLAVVTLITLPPDGPLRGFAIGGIVALSLIVGVLVNGVSMQDFRKVSRDHREASNRYDTLTARLGPLLYNGIEDDLHRRAKALKRGGDLKFSVWAPISGLYVLVGTTLPSEDPVRQVELEPGEGVPGYLANRKVAGFAPAGWHAKGEANRPVFDRAGEQIGEVPPLREVNKGKAPVSEKWHYCRPIFERSSTTPWSNHIVGVLSVHSSADDGDSLFKTAEFQHLVDSVASEVSSYLDAIQVLVAEQKP